MDLFLARAIKKFTQWDVAIAAGISQAQYSLYEGGFRQPSEKAKMKIAAALGLAIDAIEWPQSPCVQRRLECHPKHKQSPSGHLGERCR